MSTSEKFIEEFAGYFISGDAETAIRRAREIMEDDLAAVGFFQGVFTPSMELIGERFGRLEIYLPELMVAAETAQAVIEAVVRPAIRVSEGDGYLSRGRIAIGSVRGDLHTIGKGMVALMLEVNGFEVLDLGVDVPPKEFLDRAMEFRADIVGLSALMTTSMPYMREVIELRNALGYQDKFSVIVGGAPVTLSFSEDIGADAFGTDAIDAVKKCMQLMEGRSTK